MKDKDKEFFECDGLVVTLHRDERKAKVSIRFTAANNSLDVRSGSLGFATNTGKAEGINQATLQIVEDFFTPRLGAPRSREPLQVRRA